MLVQVKKITLFSLVLVKTFLGITSRVFVGNLSLFPAPAQTNLFRAPLQGQRAPCVWTSGHNQMVMTSGEGLGQVFCSCELSSACCIESAGGWRDISLATGSWMYASVSGLLSLESPGMISVTTQETNWYYPGCVQRSWQHCTRIKGF